MIYLKSLLSNLYILAFLSGLITFFIANRIYPPLIWTLRHKELMDEPDHRSTHGEITPTMGGVGIHISFTFTLIIFASIIGLQSEDLIRILALMGATMILLFLGVKDDLVAVTPKKKIMGQVVAAAIVVLLADIRLFSFEGLMGIGVLPYSVSVLFSIFVLVAMINAFNLIDGVDGLAGGIALVVSATFGIFFLLNNNPLFVLVSFVLIGAIIGFLRYNLSEKNKIFMGDTGSMVVGFLLSFQALAFLELNALETSPFSVSNGPIMVLAVLSYPIMDTLRVFVLRIRDGRSPFSADRNHIHHRLLRLGMKHKQVALLLVFVNVFLIEFAFLTNDFLIDTQFLMVLGTVPFVFTLPFTNVRKLLPKMFAV
ncbi:MAG: undecaprenyl/decaprenyl-phosphate alpha-N-acetylglucosaminyl 1-phosphate transferase, partial [Eudoraea sp.]|nr:undecaprenyl/decaprenyl-phosphate alpha-N-acetylglucosaminyl 1-phosphate transferase [Eudoraea sp.]